MARSEKNKKNNSVKKTTLKDYFKGVKKELSRVVWPTKKELASYTVVVIGTCAIFALGFWIVDAAVLTGLKSVLGVVPN